MRMNDKKYLIKQLQGVGMLIFAILFIFFIAYAVSIT
jgi:hypothetical protein